MKKNNAGQTKTGKKTSQVIAENFWRLLIGIVLFSVSIAFIFMFENNSVKQSDARQEGVSQVVSISAFEPDQSNDGKLVHLSGEIKTQHPISDSIFGVSAASLWLKRTVEMYQWKEDVTGKKRRVYGYKGVWSEKPINSQSFWKSKQHVNPPMPYQTARYRSLTASIGSFSLSESLMKRLESYSAYPLQNLNEVPPAIKANAKLYQGRLYLAANPVQPAIGDIRIYFEIVPLMPVTIVSQQKGTSFTPYPAKSGAPFEMARPGTVSVKAMFNDEEEAGVAVLWGFRGFGFLLNLIGLFLLFKVLRQLDKNIPVLGDLVRADSFLVTATASLALCALTVGLAGILVTPFMGIVTLTLSAALFFMAAKKSKAEKL